MIYYFSFVFAIIFALFIIQLVKKSKLDEKYSVLWIFFSIIILGISIYPQIIIKIANKLGVYYPPSLMFLIALLVIVTCIIHILITITKQNKTIVKLNQELNILINRVNKLENKK